ncbi:MAG: prolyl oligopeptidase family serine peptidase [Gemmatimonadota bacterium]
MRFRWFLCCCPFIALLSAAVLSSRLPAQQSAPARHWSADDILRQESAGGLQVSPDGRWLVWVKSWMDTEKGRVANLVLSSLTADREVQLTRGKQLDTSPRWAPTGRRIAFLSTRPVPDAKGDVGRPQLWIIDPTGGEPYHLTSLVRGIRTFAWRDSATILFLAEEEPSRSEEMLKQAKDDSKVVDDSLHQPPVRLFALDVPSRTITRLTTNTDWMEQLSVSPDGRYAVTVHRRQLSYEFDQSQPPVAWLWDLATGTGTQLFKDRPRLAPSLAGWAPDGGGFYVEVDSTRHPRFSNATITLLKYYDVARGLLQPVDLDWPRGLGGAVQPVAGGAMALLADGVKLRLARLTRSGTRWTRTILGGEHAGNIFGFAASTDGRTIAYVHSAASTPPQLYRAAVDGDRLGAATQLTRLNPSFAAKPTPKTEIVRFRGARRDEVEGILYYPLDYEPGKKYPLILSIHGGPASADLDAWSDRWAYPHMLLAERGAFQLKVNYHGSSNYGLDWVESICCGKYYDLEIPDLIAGLDYVVRRGLADTARLATMGWSNGAILSTELTTRLPRLKAASVGAGDVEWISDWGNVDFGKAFDNYYFGKAPYEDPQLYIRKSPFFRLDKVRTPTLIFFGTEDRNVPPSQGWSHYRALQQHGKTETRFVLFPGEPHGLQQLAHQRRKIAEDLAWFDRHLFGYEPAAAALTAALARESFDSTSPLGLAIRRQGVARVNGLYGERMGGVLVPEVIPVPRADSIGREYPFLLGRFEVTRAQWAAYDSTYTIEPGTENHPVGGVSFERAKDYVSWLVAKTGGKWRLGTEKELRPLYDAAGASGETTLDWWAGYRLNPDDAARIAERVSWLTAPAPLLRPVGSGSPSLPRALIFDLGGNVSEWAIGADGKGVLLGGSADRPADPRARRAEAGEEYRGLRVVRER